MAARRNVVPPVTSLEVYGSVDKAQLVGLINAIPGDKVRLMAWDGEGYIDADVTRLVAVGEGILLFHDGYKNESFHRILPEDKFGSLGSIFYKVMENGACNDAWEILLAFSALKLDCETPLPKAFVEAHGERLREHLEDYQEELPEAWRYSLWPKGPVTLYYRKVEGKTNNHRFYFYNYRGEKEEVENAYGFYDLCNPGEEMEINGSEVKLGEVLPARLDHKPG